MDDYHACTPMPSPEGEAGLRPAEHQPNFTKPDVTGARTEDLDDARQLLIRTFAVPPSGIGLRALAHELRGDLDVLDSPTSCIELRDALRTQLEAICPVGMDPGRDLADLRSLKACPLRDFLTPPSLTLPSPERRCLRSARALVALHLLSQRNRLGGPQAKELARWMQGKGLRFAAPHLSAEELRLQRDRQPPDSIRAALITVLVEALTRRLSNPFVTTKTAPVVSRSSCDEPPQAHETVAQAPMSPDDQPPADPLRGRQAAIGFVGCRILSGIPDLYEYAQPFELEAIVPRILDRWRAGQEDEAVAALLTLHLGVMPSSFRQVPLTLESGAGIRINLADGCIEWNLDEVIGRNGPDKPFDRSPSDRYVQVPLPSEIVVELRKRQQQTSGKALADLFGPESEDLGRATKSMLREVSLTSHRPTLKRLSRSWGRYILSRTGDETYASAIGIDFTLGTTANFNYCLLRAARIRSIVGDCYRRIGLSGKCGGGLLSDIGSLRLIPHSTAGNFIRASLAEVRTAMTDLPRRCTIERVHDAHNAVAKNLYAVLKFVLAGRSLEEETLTRQCLDLDTGLCLVTDKRTAPYHEHRLGCLPPTLRAWLRAYFAWLGVVAYRVASIHPRLAHAIRSVSDGDMGADRHPLFFRLLPNIETAPLGSRDIVPILAPHRVAPNGGRHFNDALFRDAGLDSAAVMGWMGRGMPGQEVIGTVSSVVPLDLLHRCSDVIESWLSGLALPPAPPLSSRALPAMRLPPTPVYRPQLLNCRPASLTPATGAQRCPVDRDTIHLAASFPDLLRTWRTNAPPPGWAAIALSLILEDGVVLDQELTAALQELQQGTLFRHGVIHFVDARPAALGIRRVWLSPVTVRLIYQTSALDAAPVTLEMVSGTFKDFLTKAGIHSVRRPPIGFVTASARAYFALRTPGVLRAWMSGTSFSRTARPQYVARQYLGLCEPGAPHSSRNPRAARKPDEFRKTAYEICKHVPHKKSHRKAIDELRQWLTDIGTEDEPDSEHQLLVGYCGSLLDRHDNVHTVLRYLTAATPFLRSVSDAIASAGFDGVDWLRLINLALRDEPTQDGHDSAPTRAAINQALDWLGIDHRIGRRTGPPPSALKYTDLLTDREIRSATAMLAARRQSPGDEWHRAETALRLMFDVAMRWDEVVSLRLADVWVGSVPPPHIVVTYESRASLKTTNARRVLPLKSEETIRELRTLYELRRARFGEDKLVPLLGADLEERTVDTSSRIHDLVTQALRQASGSSDVHPHCTRGTVITGEIDALMSADQSGQRRPMDLRQAVYSISARAGHGHPDVTLGDYFAGMDRQRRQWVTAIVDAADCPARPAFLERLTGIAAETYRKRLSRGGSDRSFDVLEGLKPIGELTVGAKVCELGSLVQTGLEEIPWTDATLKEERLTATGIYLGLRMLKEDSHSARLAARMTPQEAERIERVLSTVQRPRVTPLASRRSICHKRFITDITKHRLPATIAACNPDAATLRDVIGAVKTLGNPLAFSRLEHAIQLRSILGPIHAVGIQTECLVRVSGLSATDTYWQSRFRAAGFGSARCRPARHFPRSSACLVQFSTKPSKPNSDHRASPPLAFLVTVSILAVHVYKELEQ